MVKGIAKIQLMIKVNRIVRMLSVIIFSRINIGVRMRGDTLSLQEDE
jgi:hypothetical protein